MLFGLIGEYRSDSFLETSLLSLKSANLSVGFIVKKVKEKLFGSMEGRITEGTPEERGRIRNGPWDL